MEGGGGESEWGEVGRCGGREGGGGARWGREVGEVEGEDRKRA